MVEFLNRSAPLAEPLARTESPVLVQELEAFLGLPSAAEATLQGLLDAATDAAVSFLGHDIQRRQWRATWWDWPTVGTIAGRNLSLRTGREAREVELPYAQAAEVVAVASYGESVTDFIARDRAIVLNGAGANGSNDEPALTVTYWPVPDGYFPPSSVLHGVLMLAAWMFEHRGACDAMEALRRSGAAGALTPLRRAELLW